MKESNEYLVGLIAESKENSHFDELTGFDCPDCDFVTKKHAWSEGSHDKETPDESVLIRYQ